MKRSPMASLGYACVSAVVEPQGSQGLLQVTVVKYIVSTRVALSTRLWLKFERRLNSPYKATRSVFLNHRSRARLVAIEPLRSPDIPLAETP